MVPHRAGYRGSCLVPRPGDEIRPDGLAAFSFEVAAHAAFGLKQVSTGNWVAGQRSSTARKRFHRAAEESEQVRPLHLKIVSVGAHFNLIEFLDRKRGGMSSTFLTRLRIGEKLVDAKGVSRLYNPAATAGPLVLFLAAFAILVAIVVITSPALNDLFQLVWLKIRIWLGL